MHNASMMKSVVKMFALNVLMMNGRDLMPTGYVEYDGVKLTRRELRAVEKYDKGENLDHFDKQALERAEEKFSKNEEKWFKQSTKASKIMGDKSEKEFNIQMKALEKKYEKK